jgi:hypothetical protein
MRSLLSIAATAPWLSKTGVPVELPEPSLRPSLQVWRRFIRHGVAAELLGRDIPPSPLARFEWLTHDGPNPNSALKAALSAPLPAQLRRERLLISKQILSSLSTLEASQWLVVGSTDLRDAMRAAAGHAFRMAAAEQHFSVVGFWSTIVSFYAAGVWPAGVADNVVVAP